MTKEERKELADIQKRLKRLSDPNYYGCWCKGYLVHALKEREKVLLAKQNPVDKR